MYSSSIARIFERHGLRFSRQTTCDWARQLAELRQPLYELMVQLVLESADRWLAKQPTGHTGRLRRFLPKS